MLTDPGGSCRRPGQGGSQDPRPGAQWYSAALAKLRARLRGSGPGRKGTFYTSEGCRPDWPVYVVWSAGRQVASLGVVVSRRAGRCGEECLENVVSGEMGWEARTVEVAGRGRGPGLKEVSAV